MTLEFRFFEVVSKIIIRFAVKKIFTNTFRLIMQIYLLFFLESDCL